MRERRSHLWATSSSYLARDAILVRGIDGRVHGIVRNHEGGITVHSRPGDGAEFSIHFPALSNGAPRS